MVETLIDTSKYLFKNKDESVSQVENIGSLMYLMTCTKSDIGYTISKLSGHTSNLGADH